MNEINQNRVTNDIELAKSWYQLAIVFATLAGMAIVAAGMFWQPITDLIEPMRFAKESCSPLLNINSSISNFTFEECYSKIANPILSLWGKTTKFVGFFIFLGVLLGLNSIYIWILGYFRLNYPYKKTGRQFVILLIADAVFIIVMVCLFL